MSIVVSACLMGENCKYSGGNNFHSNIVEFLKGKDIILVCPEVEGGLSIPRSPVELVDGQAISRDGQDVTKEFEMGVNTILKRIKDKDIEMVILQSRSPSCGVKQIYDGTYTGTLIDGQGMLAKALTDNGYLVVDSSEFSE